MNIIIGGDFFIADKNKNHNLFDESLLKLFRNADYRILNLEAPLTPDIPKNKIKKTGPHLRSSEETVLPYLNQLNIDLVSLANNHILDYGSKGLSDTFNALSKNNIAYVGAGKNLNEAAKSHTIEKDGVKLAILNFAEKEWSIAGQNTPGANPLDIIDNVNQIKAAKNTHDKVICIIHGGHEHYSLPSPRMVKQYRFYADNEADAIIGHHTHCISGYEVYKGVPIIYSLGNFLFTRETYYPTGYEGLIAKLSVGSTVNFELIPIRQNQNKNSVNLINENEKLNSINYLEALNEALSNPIELKMRWNSFIDDNQSTYLTYLSPVNGIKNRFIRTAFLKIGIRFISYRYLLFLSNILSCQAHADILKHVVKNKIR